MKLLEVSMMVLAEASSSLISLLGRKKKRTKECIFQLEFLKLVRPFSSMFRTKRK